MVSEIRTRQVGIPTAVRDVQEAQLRRHLERVTRDSTDASLWSPTIARWWSSTASEFGVTAADGGEELATTTDETSNFLVLVDALRTPQLQDELETVGARGGPTRLVFCDLGSAEGRGLGDALAPVDITGVLWASGLSVIDVDRIPVRTPKGIWNVVAGIARRTPQPE